MLVISLATRDTPYEWDCARRLKASCDRLGLELDVELIESRWLPDGRNDWLWACHQIPVICHRAMCENPGEPILYVDADATIERDPRPYLEGLLAQGVDFAVHHLRHPDGRLELLDGTMLLASTHACRRLLEEWITADAAAPGEWEQRILQRGLHGWADFVGARVAELPPEYCLIFDHAHQRAQCAAEPVVVHHQASRQYKRMPRPRYPSTECLLLRRCEGRSVAVVGNGPIADGTGPLIDGHDVVIRINDACLAGLESVAGARSDLWCTNAWYDVPNRWDLGTPLTVWHPDLDQHPVGEWAQRVECGGLHAPQVSWAARCASGLKVEKPTTGLVLLYMLRELGIACDAYGFTGRGAHYWDAEHQGDHPEEQAALAALGQASA